MAHYVIHTARSPRYNSTSHIFLIGPPLLIISAFCFSYVLMQPHATSQTSITTPPPSASFVGNAKANLAALPFKPQISLSIIKMSPPSTANTLTSRGATASPQPTGTSPLILQSDAIHNQQFTSDLFEHTTINQQSDINGINETLLKIKTIFTPPHQTNNKNESR